MNEPVFTEEGVLVIPSGWTSEQLGRWREKHGLPAIQTWVSKRNANYRGNLREKSKKGTAATNRGAR